MKFSLLYELQNPRPWTAKSEYEKYWEAITQIELADRVGFDCVWTVEHHFLSEYSHSSAPEVFYGALSQRTKNIRLGHGVVLLPFPYNHPIRVAERVAALDILSNGRVEFGTGRSATLQELGGFQVDYGETRAMWEEGLEVIIKAWTDETLAHAGRLLHVPPRAVVPKPIQRPHPPVWMAATSNDTYDIAGQKGIGVLSFAFNPKDVTRGLEVYRRAIGHAQPVGKFVNNQFAALTVAHCAAATDAARETAFAGARWFLGKVREQFLSWQGTAAKSYEYLEKLSAAAQRQRDMTDDELAAHPQMVIGDPDVCIRKLEEIERWGIDQVICFMQFGRVPHRRVMDSIRLLGEHVLPRFRARNAAPSA